MDKKAIINFFIIVGKFLAPIGKLIVKLAKMAKVVKVALVAGSFAAYAYMFTWQFALIILGFLLVHEYGHIWAMKRCGMKTKGMYFIPFLGAAAVADSDFKSYKDEVFIALMGPVWGIFLALFSCGIYKMTGQVVFAGAAIWMFLVTLFNLLPIMPLDGGRVARSIAMSMSSWGGVIVFVLSIGLLILFSAKIGIGLVIFFLVVGGIEILGEFSGLFSKKRKLKFIRDTIKNGCFLAREKDKVYVPKGIGSVELVYRIEDVEKVIKLNPDGTDYLLSEYNKVLNSIREPMKKGVILLSAISLLFVAGASVSLMYQLKHIPGAEMALDILKDKKEPKK
jgi:Zn-dependent protease